MLQAPWAAGDDRLLPQGSSPCSLPPTAASSTRAGKPPAGAASLRPAFRTRPTRAPLKPTEHGSTPMQYVRAATSMPPGNRQNSTRSADAGRKRSALPTPKPKQPEGPMPKPKRSARSKSERASPLRFWGPRNAQRSSSACRRCSNRAAATMAQSAAAALMHRRVSIASSQRLHKREMPTSRASNSPKRRLPISRPGWAMPVRSQDRSAPPHRRLPSRRPPRRPPDAMRRTSDHRGVRQMPSPRGRPQAAPGRAAAERAEAGCSTTPHARKSAGRTCRPGGRRCE